MRRPQIQAGCASLVAADSRTRAPHIDAAVWTARVATPPTTFGARAVIAAVVPTAIHGGRRVSTTLWDASIPVEIITSPAAVGGRRHINRRRGEGRRTLKYNHDRRMFGLLGRDHAPLRMNLESTAHTGFVHNSVDRLHGRPGQGPGRAANSRGLCLVVDLGLLLLFGHKVARSTGERASGPLFCRVSACPAFRSRYAPLKFDAGDA